MEHIPTSDHADMERRLADLDAVDFNDLDEDFQGGAINDERWAKYQTVARALLAAKNQGCGIVKVNHLAAPDPQSEHASVMLVLNKVSDFDGYAKAALILAASMCDRIAITTSGDKVRMSFAVEHIWKEGGNTSAD